MENRKAGPGGRGGGGEGLEWLGGVPKVGIGCWFGERVGVRGRKKHRKGGALLGAYVEDTARKPEDGDMRWGLSEGGNGLREPTCAEKSQGCAGKNASWPRENDPTGESARTGEEARACCAEKPRSGAASARASAPWPTECAGWRTNVGAVAKVPA